MQKTWNSRTAVIAFLVLIVVPIPAAVGQIITGKLSGVVAGDDGKPLSAMVTATHIGKPTQSIRVQSKPDGSFMVTDLFLGTYEFCAVVNDDVYLDPCLWSAKLPSVELTAAQPSPSYRLVLKKGGRLAVRINDPQRALAATVAPGKAAPQVILGVFSDRHLFHSFAVVSSDAQGQIRSGTVPIDKNVSLHLMGSDVDVLDAKGAKVDINGTNVIVTPSLTNSALPPLTFTVSPRKP
jgi:hypothetical protein